MNGDPLRQFVGRLCGATLTGLPDGQLLGRFVEHRDEAAFEALVDRHGPMVWGVCRRTVGDEHAAEDVYQAAFLLLARKAGDIRERDSVGSWLHGAALRLGRKLASRSARFRRPDHRPPHPGPPDPSEELGGREVLGVLDEELARLPEHYRLALVMCHLEGRTRDEAAACLGWTPGQVKGRLERGRRLLHARLDRRGVTPSLFPPALSAPALAVERIARTIPAGATVSDRALALTEGALQAMSLIRWKSVAGLALAVAMAGGGAGVWLGARSQADDPPRPANPDEPAPPGANAPQPIDPEAAARKMRDSLKQIALAMHDHHDAINSFPASATVSREDSAPLLSWRVTLLPYLGHQDLFHEFKQDEPWDSPHNKRLIARMPDVYRVPGLGSDRTTIFQVIVGRRCVFEEPEGVRSEASEGLAEPSGFPGADLLGPRKSVQFLGTGIHQITDGMSNTLLVVEGESAVPWTQPADIPYSAAGRLPNLGGLVPGVFHAAFADGSVHAIDGAIPEVDLRRMITRDDGYPVDKEKFIDPILTSDPEQLRRENRELAAAVVEAREQLVELISRQRERESRRTPDGREPTAVEILRAEQRLLRRELDRLHAEMGSLLTESAPE